jgi:hypothetical protein
LGALLDNQEVKEHEEESSLFKEVCDGEDKSLLRLHKKQAS